MIVRRRQLAGAHAPHGSRKIQTTLVYVQLTPQDVYQQYARAVAQHIRRIPSVQS